MKHRLLFLLACLPVLAWADNFEYTTPEGVVIKMRTIDDATACIGQSNGTATNGGCITSRPDGVTTITIPEKVTYNGVEYTVTRVTLGSFFGCDWVEKISLPNTIVEGINTSTVVAGTTPTSLFRNCTSLKEANIPAGITALGNYCFAGCTALETYEIPERITKIGSYTFNGCTALKSVTLHEGLTSMGGYTFNGCTSLVSAHIPKSVQSIGTYFFNNCTSLSDVSLPDTMPSGKVPNYFLYNCGNLDTIIFPEGWTSVGTSSFVNAVARVVSFPSTYTGSFACVGTHNSTTPNTRTEKIIYKGTNASIMNCNYFDNLTEVDLSESKIKTVYSSAFNNDPNLTTIKFPPTLTTIGSSTTGGYAVMSVFGGCPIDTLRIPATVNTVNGVAICYGMPNLKAVIFEGDSLNTTGNSAFGNCPSLEYVRLPKRMGDIGANAFSGCEALTEVVMPEQMTGAVNSGAFRNCTALRTVNIPEGCTTIGSNAFNSCAISNAVSLPNVTRVLNGAFTRSNVKGVSFGEKLYQIGDSAFQRCTQLATAQFADRVDSLTIGTFAFRYCTSLQEAVLPNGATAWGTYSFSDCTRLKKLSLGTGPTTTGSLMAYGCTALTDVTIAEGCKTIATGTFNGCTNLRQIQLPSTVTSLAGTSFANTGLTSFSYEGNISLGQSVFANCASLASVTLPNLRTVGAYCFDNTGNLTQFDFGSQCRSVGNYAFRNSGLRNVVLPSHLISATHVFDGNQYLTDIRLVKSELYPDSTFNIGDYALASLTALTNITLSADIDTIGENAFQYDSLLTTVTLPDGLKCIKSYAFTQCRRLEEIVIPNSVDTLGNGVFSACLGLKKATLSDRLQTIPGSLFYNCNALTELQLPSSLRAINSMAFYGCGLREIEIPASVEELGPSVFYNCRAIKEIRFAENSRLKTLKGNYTFNNCTSLQSISLPDSITSIRDDDVSTQQQYGTFNGCTSLREVHLPAQLRVLPSAMFRDCSSLEAITIPAAVETIGSHVFSGCGQLKTVAFEDESQLKEIGQCLFANTANINVNYQTNNSVRSLVLPAGVKTIGAYAFSGLTALEELVLPDSLTAISNNFADRCTKLVSISLPAAVQEVGANAFLDCNALTSVVSLNTVPPTADDKAFTTTTTGKATLFVPEESVEAYKAADVWKLFSRIAVANTDPDAVAIDETNFPDDALRNYIRNNSDLKGIGDDGYLTQSEMESVKRIVIVNQGVADATGIERFVNLEHLEIVNTQNERKLSTINLSTLTKLQTLILDGNSIGDIDLSAQAELTSLSLRNNRLTAVNTANTPKLTTLNIAGNKFATLALPAALTALTTVNAADNQLEALTIEAPAITSLRVDDNKIAALNIAALTQLATLNVANNLLETLHLYGISTLTTLNASGNKLTEVAFDGLTALTELNIADNSLAALNTDALTALKQLVAYENALTAVDLHNNTALLTLDLSNNELNTLDLRNNTQLTTINVEGNHLAAIDLSRQTQLTTAYYLTLGGQTIHSDVRYFNELRTMALPLPEGVEADRITAVQLNGTPLDEVDFITADGKSWLIFATDTDGEGYRDQTVTYSYNPKASSLPDVRMNVACTIEDTTTGISTSEASPRGGLEGAWYTLDGRKLTGTPTQPGIYLHNGKKVTVK